MKAFQAIVIDPLHIAHVVVDMRHDWDSVDLLPHVIARTDVFDEVAHFVPHRDALHGCPLEERPAV